MAGRKPLAAEIKVATGAYRKNPQLRNKQAPKANGQRPVMPEWFDEHETEKWNELVDDLTKNGVISSDNREILIAYCTAYSKWREAMAKVNEEGLVDTIIDQAGNTKTTVSGWAKTMNAHREHMNKLLPEMGLTPASRQKVSKVLVDDKPEDPFAKIMARMGRG